MTGGNTIPLAGCPGVFKLDPGTDQASSLPTWFLHQFLLVFLPWFPLMMNHDLEIEGKQTLPLSFGTVFYDGRNHNNKNPRKMCGNKQNMGFQIHKLWKENIYVVVQNG